MFFDIYKGKDFEWTILKEIPQINAEPIVDYTCNFPAFGFVYYLLYHIVIVGACFYACVWMKRVAGEILEDELRKVVMVASAFIIINVCFIPAYVVSNLQVKYCFE